jgi:Putative adhesin
MCLRRMEMVREPRVDQVKRVILPLLTVGVFLVPVFPAYAAATTQRVEKEFNVTGHPVVVIHNVANGRIEVKSWKNAHQVEVIGTQPSNKIGFDIDQVGDRVDVNANILDPAAQPLELEADLQLTVPEETELQLKTETGLIYVEQVNGDMKLESYAGDVHLKEVSGYIIVKTTGGSLICTQCAGKLDFSSISGNAQLLQPQLNNVNLMTTTGNILFDGAFVRTGLYSMRSGKGLVEVRFSSNDSFDLKAQTSTGFVDNQAADFLKPDNHKVRNFASKAIHGFVGTVGAGLAKVELSSYSGTIRIMRRD